MLRYSTVTYLSLLWQIQALWEFQYPNSVSIIVINSGGDGHFDRNNAILDALTIQMYLDKL